MVVPPALDAHVDVCCVNADRYRHWIQVALAPRSVTFVASRNGDSVAGGRCFLVGDGAPQAAHEIVRVIRQARPGVPIVYVFAGTAPARDLVTLSRAGIDVFVHAGAEDLGQRVDDLIGGWTARHASHAAFAAVRDVVPEQAQDIVAWCLDEGGRRCTVNALASELGVHRRTIVKRLRSAGVVPASELISWARLIHAVSALRDEGRRVEEVALTLGFGSGSALRNMLRRYAGVRPNDLRGTEGLTQLLTAFRRAIVRAPAGSVRRTHVAKVPSSTRSSP
jgi:AraC-like DNA-binding protein